MRVTMDELRRARLNGNKDFEGFDLTDMDFFGSGLLAGCNLRGACFEVAILSKARFHGADLRDAKLNHADLSGANLRGANLRFASLLGVNLRYADLRGADLIGADLSDALFFGVNHDEDTRWPDGFDVGRTTARVVQK